MKAPRVILMLMALAFSSCAREDGVLFDGKRLFSTTDKGQIEVALPDAVTRENESTAPLGLDRLLEIARGEISLYTATPASEWQLAMLFRQRLEGGLEYFVFQFQRPQSFEEWIQVPISLQGIVLARPDPS